MTTTTVTSPGGSVSNALENTWGWIKKIPPVYPVFFDYLYRARDTQPSSNINPANGIMTFLRTASPLAVLADR